MAIKRPTQQQMKDIAADLGMSLSDDQIADFIAAMDENFKSYDALSEMSDEVPQVEYPRTPGYRPTGDENPYNAWYVKSEITGQSDGPLKGKTAVLKDNICVAGVPMMNGSSTLEGYMPEIDATVVTRLLDAGSTVMGKAHCENLCLSGGSHTNVTGAVHNPYRMGYSSGGSSSGTAVLVSLGEVDLGVGGDQGGSIRIPASFSGICGMKPTHGLVPYTGAMPIEATIDHLGPMTRTVADNALMLEVLAGEDGLDPRQYNVKTEKYTEALDQGVKGLKIGILKEGFGFHNSEADVDASVRAAARQFEALGADVSEVSIPMHLDGPIIWTPISLEGTQWQMMHGNGMAKNWKGLYTTSLSDTHANWRDRADELSDTLKVVMLSGEYFDRQYRGRYYGKAQNLVRRLTAAYDRALAQYDVLLMPTTPMKATPLPPDDAQLTLYIQRAFEMIANVAPFNATGHPAMAVPCGMSDGLPTSMQLVGKKYDEFTIYKAAAAYEAACDWTKN